MISSLNGKVKSKQEKNIVVNVNGVGYLVSVPRPVLEKIEEGQSIELSIHTNVREDDISLYGFLTKEEWRFFRLLLTVSGVGPKSALEILSMPLARVQQAIAKKDVAALTRIPGIGKKTAERIIVDLQGKVKEQLMEEEALPDEKTANEDIVQALVSLGYHRHQVLSGLKKVPTEIADEKTIIKYFLQNI